MCDITILRATSYRPGCFHTGGNFEESSEFFSAEAWQALCLYRTFATHKTYLGKVTPGMIGYDLVHYVYITQEWDR